MESYQIMPNRNAYALSVGVFAGDSSTMDDIAQAMLEDEGFFMTEEGVLIRGDTISGAQNATAVSDGTFAASIAGLGPSPNPRFTDQWYNKDRPLFAAEVISMKKRHPKKCKYGFLPDSGDMYWIIELKVGDYCDPWQFMLRYMKNHPNNMEYGGSIRVCLLKKPSVDTLFQRARMAGRRGVPHILSDKNSDGETYYYLCTRRTEDVESGAGSITTAVQVAAWAAEWASYFEVSMKNRDVWNKWVDDDHFRSWQI
ncbi:MAG: hypothetical protein IJQ81_12090 [Oscillibacter sp.]|nr:hypothetical protein [Oscillibacter sp.]